MKKSSETKFGSILRSEQLAQSSKVQEVKDRLMIFAPNLTEKDQNKIKVELELLMRKSLRFWNEEDVSYWLVYKVGFPQYVAKFQDKNIDGDILARISETEIIT